MFTFDLVASSGKESAQPPHRAAAVAVWLDDLFMPLLSLSSNLLILNFVPWRFKRCESLQINATAILIKVNICFWIYNQAVFLFSFLYVHHITFYYIL